MLARAVAVGDTGKVYDPARLRFDHHQSVDLPCATALLYAYLLQQRRAPASIEPLVALINDGDTGRAGARQSAQTGIHAMLTAYKRQNQSDRAVLEWGCEQLDLLAAALEANAAARLTLDSCMVYRSADDRVIGVRGGGSGVTHAAHDVYGARVVVFINEEAVEGGTTWAVGAQRLGGAAVTTPHVGDLVASVLANTERADVAEELGHWFCHPAGFFAGRGTRKAPDPTPPAAGLIDICAALDAAWER